MKLSCPSYYDDFRCIASACPDSCCKEWSVCVDAESAEFYRGLPGPLGDRLRQVLVEEDGDTVMKIENGRCPMWRDDGLCRIQAELGEIALCDTCRDFPRLLHDFGDFGELQLELSCPEAARLILTSPIAPRIVWEEAEDEEGEYDPGEMARMLALRDRLTAILAEEPLTAAQALTALCRTAIPDIAPGAGDFPGLLEVFHNLEVLNPAWPEKLAAARPAPLHPMAKPLAVYLLERYWLREPLADLRGKLSFVVSACILISALPGAFPENAQSWSKEIENSDCNPEELLLAAHTEPAMRLESLLALL